MIILVGSKIDQSSIQSSLGKPEYSYYFLMKDFLPLLERLGTVVIVDSIAEIESLTAAHREAGEQVVFFSFSPPHQVPLGLPCKTIAVFAWEFDSLPSAAWDGNPQNDWSYVFSRTSGAIATSREAAGLVEIVAPKFLITALPAPVWDRFAALGCSDGCSVELGARKFHFAGVIIDSPLLGLSADGLVRKPVETPNIVEPEPEPVSAQKRLCEAWQQSAVLLTSWWSEVRRPMVDEQPLLSPMIEPILIEPDDVVAEVEVEVITPPLQQIQVQGVVYTTLLNPADARKNWVEIITAFCWAFKENEDVTLIVKMTHHDLEYYRIVLITLLSRLAPFRCRVLVLHGFLDDNQYRELVSATTYYVNASSGEGLCLPLMEFLSAGKPAMAPAHTAMADYMDEKMGFVVKCSLEPFCWPHDPARIFTTHRHRLNWQSLMEAFRSSYAMACCAPLEYRQLSANAFCRMRNFASIDVLEQPLRAFLDEVLMSEGDPTVPVSAKAGQKP